MDKDSLTKKVIKHYEQGDGSIQEIARTYRLTVEEVLGMIGQTDVMEVEGIGDLIGSDEAGFEVPIIANKKYQAKFTTD